MLTKTLSLAAIWVVLTYLAFDAGTTQALTHLVTRGIQHVIQSISSQATPGDTLVANLPEIPVSTTGDIPAYLTLCQEWLRHDARYKDDEHQDLRAIKTVDICMDWSSPHFSLMEIFAALVVSPHVPRIQYRHNCNTQTSNDEPSNVLFDFTTIQQALNAPPGSVKVDHNLVSLDDLKQQCKRCLLSFDSHVEGSRVKSRAFHHCFVWPESASNLRVDVTHPEQIPYVPYNYPGVTPVPLSSIIVAVRAIFHNAVLDWREKMATPKEPDGSVVYWIDPTTIGLRYEDVLAEIPHNATSIAILAGPLCAIGTILPTGEKCHEYGKGLAQYLSTRFSHLQDDGEAVSFSILTSTAAAYSRMISAPLLICPPRSNTCLLPAAAKLMGASKAVVLEDPSWMKAVDFMVAAGHHGTTTTKILPADKIPPMKNWDSEHQQELRGSANAAASDSEGYPIDVSKRRPNIPSDDTIQRLSSQEVLGDIATEVVRFKGNANLLHIRDERHLTAQEVERAVARGEPLLGNHHVQWDPHFFQDTHPSLVIRSTYFKNAFRHAELATDADSGRKAQAPTTEHYEDSTARRHASMLRMQRQDPHYWSVRITNHRQQQKS